MQLRPPLHTNTKPAGAQAHRAGVSHTQGIAPSATFSLASCTLDLSDSSDHPHPAMFHVDPTTARMSTLQGAFAAGASEKKNRGRAMAKSLLAIRGDDMVCVRACV
jgi:hypothetical protein